MLDQGKREEEGREIPRQKRECPLVCLHDTNVAETVAFATKMEDLRET